MSVVGKNILFATLFGLLALNACNTNGCLENQSSLPLAGFYSSSTLSKITVDSISVYAIGVPGDSMMLDCKSSVSQVYMPFDLVSNTTRYVIHYNQQSLSDESNNDTITISYDAVPYFVSSDCGAVFYYDIREYSWTPHLIDSISMETRITNVNAENIKVFFRTSTN